MARVCVRACMMQLQDRAGRPLPKFGEWDVKNPATADGFTVIFQKARDGKKTGGPGNVKAGIPPAFRDQHGSAGDGGYRSGNTPPKRTKVNYLQHLESIHAAAAMIIGFWIES